MKREPKTMPRSVLLTPAILIAMPKRKLRQYDKQLADLIGYAPGVAYTKCLTQDDALAANKFWNDVMYRIGTEWKDEILVKIGQELGADEIAVRYNNERGSPVLRRIRIPKKKKE